MYSIQRMFFYTIHEHVLGTAQSIDPLIKLEFQLLHVSLAELIHAQSSIKSRRLRFRFD